MRLDGKVAVITGASSGIGQATAHLFAQEGAKVALIDINDHDGLQVADAINRQGGHASYIRCDVSQENEVDAAITRTVEAFGKLNVLFNNAGIAFFTPVENTPLEEFEQTVAVNFRGVFLMTKHALPHMRKAGGGSIINTASVNATLPSTDLGAYAGTKGAVVAFSKVVAGEHAIDNIRCNCVSPGGVDTPINDGVFKRLGNGDRDAGRRELGAIHPLYRVADPGEIAMAVLFLASDESSFVTATDLHVDGGLTGISGVPNKERWEALMRRST